MTWRQKAREWTARLDRVLAASEAAQQARLDANPAGLPNANKAKSPGPLESRLAAAIPIKGDPGSEPRVVEVPNQDGSVTIYGVPGTLISSGFIVPMGEFNPLLMGREGVDVWEKMRRTDSQVDKTLEMCVAPIIGAKWDVGAPDLSELEDGPAVSSTGAGKATQAKAEEIARAARSNLFGGLEYDINGSKHTQTWNEALRSILLMLPMGCSAYEEVFAVDGDQARLAMLGDLPPKTYYQWDVEEDGRTLRALIQLGYRGQLFTRLEVPAENLNVFTHRQEGADFWGRSILRAAYSHWYAKNLLYRIRNIAAERTSIGVPCITLGPNNSKEDHDLAVLYVTQLAAHQKTGLVLPSGATFEIKGVTGATFNSMEDVIHHNEQISFVALDFFSNLGRGGSSGASGNRALGEGQGKFFMLALQNTADFIAQRITNVTLRRWTAYNFGFDAPVPELRAANVQARSFAEVMSLLTQAAQGGLVKSDKGIRDEIRTESGMPQETDEDVIAGRGETVSVGPETGTIGPGQEQPENANAQKGEAAQLSEAAGKKLKIQNSKSTRATVSPFWREGHDPALQMVHPREAHVDFPGHADAMDMAEGKAKRALLQAKRGLVRQISGTIAAQIAAGKPASAAGLPHTSEAAAPIEQILNGVYAHAANEIRAEHSRLNGGSRAMALADSPAPEGGSGEASAAQLIADLALERYIGELGQGVRRASLQVRAPGAYDLASMSKSEIADLLYDGVLSPPAAGVPAVSANLEDNVAASAVRGAFRQGRSDAAQAIVNELARQGITARFIRVGILDKNICGPCAAADGKAWDPEIPVSTICEGGDLCRCEPVEVRA